VSKWELALGWQRWRCDKRVSGSGAHKCLLRAGGRVGQESQVAEASGQRLGIPMGSRRFVHRRLQSRSIAGSAGGGCWEGGWVGV
jgi:hypothetical protein